MPEQEPVPESAQAQELAWGPVWGPVLERAWAPELELGWVPESVPGLAWNREATL